MASSSIPTAKKPNKFKAYLNQVLSVGGKISLDENNLLSGLRAFNYGDRLRIFDKAKLGGPTIARATIINDPRISYFSEEKSAVTSNIISNLSFTTHSGRDFPLASNFINSSKLIDNPIEIFDSLIKEFARDPDWQAFWREVIEQQRAQLSAEEFKLVEQEILKMQDEMLRGYIFRLVTVRQEHMIDQIPKDKQQPLQMRKIIDEIKKLMEALKPFADVQALRNEIKIDHTVMMQETKTPTLDAKLTSRPSISPAPQLRQSTTARLIGPTMPTPASLASQLNMCIVKGKKYQIGAQKKLTSKLTAERVKKKIAHAQAIIAGFEAQAGILNSDVSLDKKLKAIENLLKIIKIIESQKQAEIENNKDKVFKDKVFAGEFGKYFEEVQALKPIIEMVQADLRKQIASIALSTGVKAATLTSSPATSGISGPAIATSSPPAVIGSEAVSSATPSVTASAPTTPASDSISVTSRRSSR